MIVFHSIAAAEQVLEKLAADNALDDKTIRIALQLSRQEVSQLRAALKYGEFSEYGITVLDEDVTDAPRRAHSKIAGIGNDIAMLQKLIREHNDEAALGQLCVLAEPELYKVALRLLSWEDLDQAPDLINKAFLQIIQLARESCLQEHGFSAMCKDIMTHIVVLFYKRRRTDAMVLSAVLGKEMPTLDESLQRDARFLDLGRALDRALERLRQKDPKAADIFEIHYLGRSRVSSGSAPRDWIELSLKQIAAKMGIPLTAAYRMMSRTKTFLRHELQDYL